jgi:hypothetical protein
MLFKKKRHLLNSHILHLTFALVGTLDSGRECSVIPHRAAFENLLCDLEVLLHSNIICFAFWIERRLLCRILLYVDFFITLVVTQ